MLRLSDDMCLARRGGGVIIYKGDFQTQCCIKLTDDIGIFVPING